MKKVTRIFNAAALVAVLTAGGVAAASDHQPATQAMETANIETAHLALSPLEYVYENMTSAASEGRLDDVKAFLVEAKAFLAQGKISPMGYQETLDESLIHAAAAARNDTVRFLLSEGADPGFYDAMSLQWAAAQGHVETLRLLLEHSDHIPVTDLENARGWADNEGHTQASAVIGEAIKARTSGKTARMAQKPRLSLG